MSTYSDIIDLSKVDPPNLIDEADYDTKLGELVEKYAELYPDFEDETEYEPVRAHLGVDAWLVDQVRIRINTAGKATLLASASDSDLDVLGWARNVERKTIDEETDEQEQDEDYRSRIVMAPESWSTAGAAGAYEFWAMSVEGVKDAVAISPQPAVVDIYIIGWDVSQAASEDLIAEVLETVSAENRRPLTDLVSVYSAEVVTYQLTANLKISSGASSSVVEGEAQQGLENYQESRSYIGKSLPPSGLYAALNAEDCEEVDLDPAGGVTVGKTQIAYCLGVELTSEAVDV
ncbi:baseplate J/gp47 family protein [uncultured Cohaesibacter sp.]|uniref:baseplate assembly protein n=1 Tax=uncultured Cohaesibacter sp. TaxID=1002546 RepID=UPI002AAAF1AF|nr:baseplate J/gp47 family protein [uncultured Cohaesibacter sp.]